ncbi:hypothetical protein WG66_013309 [Moniliophthora roreri]|nr:hypothetical protein WG66_013309 [Moniliophthora roreri]
MLPTRTVKNVYNNAPRIPKPPPDRLGPVVLIALSTAVGVGIFTYFAGRWDQANNKRQGV